VLRVDEGVFASARFLRNAPSHSRRASSSCAQTVVAPIKQRLPAIISGKVSQRFIVLPDILPPKTPGYESLSARRLTEKTSCHERSRLVSRRAGSDSYPGTIFILWLRDDERMRFQLAPVKCARPLNVALLGVFRLRFVLCEIEQQTRPHLALLHLRHALLGVIEPFARQSLTVFRVSVGQPFLQPVFDQREGQIAMAELRRFERRLIALRGGQNVHAFFVSQLRKPG